MKEILVYGLVFASGILIGFAFKWRLVRRSYRYSGTIVVDRDRVSEKIVYSLVLDDYPEKLAFEKMVIFKVDTLDEKSNRK